METAHTDDGDTAIHFLDADVIHPLSNRAELEAYRQMLVDVRGRTEDAIANGLTLDAFLASNPTADYDVVWGQGV